MENDYDPLAETKEEMIRISKQPENKNIDAKMVCLDDSPLPEEQKGLVVCLKKPAMIVGRDKECEFPLISKKISRNHAKLSFDGTKWHVKDLGSTNGIILNTKKISESVLKNGDVIYFGLIPFRFEVCPVVEEKKDTPEKNSVKETFYKTMISNDLNALNALLDTKDDEDLDTVIEHPNFKKKRLEKQKNKKAHPKTRKVNYAKIAMYSGIIFLFISLMVAGFIYYNSVYKVKKEKERIVRKFNHKVKQLSNDIEFYSNRFDENAHKKDIKRIEHLLKEMEQENVYVSENIHLKSLKATLDFMRLERKVLFLIKSKQAKEAGRYIKLAEQKIAKDLDMIKNNNTENTRMLVEIGNMIRLLEIVVSYKIFQEKYPIPEPNLSKKKLSNLKIDMTILDHQKSEFIALKKKNHKVLVIKFPYFSGMVNDVEEHCFTLMYKWQVHLGE